MRMNGELARLPPWRALAATALGDAGGGGDGGLPGGGLRRAGGGVPHGRALARDPAVASLGPDVLGAGVRRGRGAPAAPGAADASHRVTRSWISGRSPASATSSRARSASSSGCIPFTPVARARGRGAAPTGPDRAALPRDERARVERRGMVTYPGLRRTTHRGDPSARLGVYGRAGKPAGSAVSPSSSRGVGSCTEHVLLSGLSGSRGRLTAHRRWWPGRDAAAAGPTGRSSPPAAR